MMKMRTFEMVRGCVTVNFAVGGDQILLNGRQVTADTMNAEYRKLQKLGFKVVKKTAAPKKPEAPKTKAPKEPRKKWHFPNGFDHHEYIETAINMGYTVWKRGDKMIVSAKDKTDIYLTMGAYYA